MFAFHRGAVQPGHQPDAAAHGPRSVALRMAAPQVTPYTLDSAAVYRLGQESERPMNGSDTPEPTPLNAPGPFYVGRDECIQCGAPEAEAPSLMAFDDYRGSCYFVRQPATPAETEQAIRAVCVSCCGAVRYGGSDLLVLQQAAGADTCDRPALAARTS